MEITVGPKNLQVLFMGNQRIEVPSFQRGYSWGKEQVNEFLDDLEASIEDKEPHFYGPVVFLKATKSDAPIDVIDGQQRLTTAVTLISVLRDLAMGLANSKFGKMDLGFVIRSSLFLPPQFTKPRFQPNYQIVDFLNTYVFPDPINDGVPRPSFGASGGGLAPEVKKATKEFRSAYFRMKDHLETKLASLTEDEQKEYIYAAWNAATELFEIHSIELYDEDQAFVLFETLNDRGLRLNPSDLLKNLTLRQVKFSGNELDFDLALKKWDQMVSQLGDYDFSKFLRHYLLLDQDEKVQSNKIFKIFKEKLKNDGQYGANENLNNLSQSAGLYSQLLGEQPHPNKEVSECIIRLNEFSDTHRVALLAVLRREQSAADVAKLCRAIESLAFRWILKGSNAQTLEDFYQKLGRAYQSFEINDEEFLSRVLDFQPVDSELRAAVTLADSRPLQKYVLKKLEYHWAHENWEKLTIEHLAPQNPDKDSNWVSKVQLPLRHDGDGNPILYDQYISMWGNLTLLSPALNSSIQNQEWIKKRDGDPSKKFDGISASTLNLNEAIKQLPEWNQEMILQRTEWIADALVQMTSEKWIKTGKFQVSKWAPLPPS
jgi:hypothetical protein